MKPLAINTPVQITAHRFAGWTGTVKAARYGQYTIAMTHDCDGERLAAPHESGPYVRRELKVLTDPQPARPGPSGATDGAVFSGAAT